MWYDEKKYVLPSWIIFTNLSWALEKVSEEQKGVSACVASSLDLLPGHLWLLYKFCPAFVHLFAVLLSRTYDMPGAVPGAGDTAVNRAASVCPRHFQKWFVFIVANYAAHETCHLNHFAVCSLVALGTCASLCDRHFHSPSRSFHLAKLRPH